MTKITYMSGSIDKEGLRLLCESIIRHIPEETWKRLAAEASLADVPDHPGEKSARLGKVFAQPGGPLSRKAISSIQIQNSTEP